MEGRLLKVADDMATVEMAQWRWRQPRPQQALAGVGLPPGWTSSPVACKPGRSEKVLHSGASGHSV